jgi:thioredoxin-dependent peroxiredoxin
MSSIPYISLFILFLSCNTTINSGQDMKKIEIGSAVPHFVLPDQNGKMFAIDSVTGKRNLVIYFYPKDDSPGCTKEACYFRDKYEVFTQADAMIIGISGQSVASHKKFAEKYHLSFTLLSDEGNRIRKLFGVPSDFFGMLPGRVTYVIAKTGKVVYIFNSQSEAKEHVDEALRILEGLNK